MIKPQFLQLGITFIIFFFSSFFNKDIQKVNLIPNFDFVLPITSAPQYLLQKTGLQIDDYYQKLLAPQVVGNIENELNAKLQAVLTFGHPQSNRGRKKVLRNFKDKNGPFCQSDKNTFCMK